jgi:ABC-type glycerol-3-phosphate transport system substrate-binding protein
MNKKAIGLLLALGMAASLAACGGGDTTTPATGESPAMSPGTSPSASPTTSP